MFYLRLEIAWLTLEINQPGEIVWYELRTLVVYCKVSSSLKPRILRTAEVAGMFHQPGFVVQHLTSKQINSSSCFIGGRSI